MGKKKLKYLLFVYWLFKAKRNLGNDEFLGSNLHCISDGSSFPDMDQAMINLMSQSNSSNCSKLCNGNVDITEGLLVNTIKCHVSRVES